jgi:hypothetical protein
MSSSIVFGLFPDAKSILIFPIENRGASGSGLVEAAIQLGASISQSEGDATLEGSHCRGRPKLTLQVAQRMGEGQCFRWYSLRGTVVYWEPGPEQPAKQLSRQPLGTQRGSNL